MEWYFAQNNQPQGPVSEAAFADLVAGRVVTDQTLVWHEGMAGWQAYGELRTGQVQSPVPPVVGVALGPHEAVCAECGQVFSKDQTILLGSAFVCATCKPIYLQRLREGVVRQAATEQRYAGFWIRFVAKFIDGVVLLILVFGPVILLTVALAPKMRPGEAPSLAGIAIQGGASLFELLVRIAYNTYFIGRFGATLGKMAVGLKVITVEGAPPTYWRAFGRAWAEQLSRIVCFIGYIIAGFDEQKRALHDHICNTRVVMK